MEMMFRWLAAIFGPTQGSSGESGLSRAIASRWDVPDPSFSLHHQHHLNVFTAHETAMNGVIEALHIYDERQYVKPAF